MRRREAYAADPEGFLADWEPRQRELRDALARAQELMPRATVDDRLLLAIARLVVRAGIGSHRADLTVLECAKAHAALDGRAAVEQDDILRAAALALGHRLPHDPFAPVPELDERDLRRMLDDVLDVELEERKKAPEPAP
jgi:Mg-chelatase subunit ChlI